MNTQEFQLLVLQKLDTLSTDVSFLKEDVSVLKEDVLELKGDVSVLKEDVSGLKTGFLGLERDVGGLNEESRNTRARLDFLEHFVHQQIDHNQQVRDDLLDLKETQKLILGQIYGMRSEWRGEIEYQIDQHVRAHHSVTS